MATEFSYSSFLSTVKKNGMLKPNRFEVLIPLPPALASTGIDTRTVSLMTKNVSIPGVNISTSNLTVVGEPLTVAWGRTFGEATFTFYVDKDLKARYLFDSWADKIQDPGTRLLGWYNDTISTITVNLLDKADNIRYTMTLAEAKPKSIGALTLDQSASDVMTFDVVMDFKYYKGSVVGVSTDAPVQNINPLTDYIGPILP